MDLASCVYVFIHICEYVWIYMKKMRLWIWEAEEIIEEGLVEEQEGNDVNIVHIWNFKKLIIKRNFFTDEGTNFFKMECIALHIFSILFVFIWRITCSW